MKGYFVKGRYVEFVVNNFQLETIKPDLDKLATYHVNETLVPNHFLVKVTLPYYDRSTFFRKLEKILGHIGLI